MKDLMDYLPFLIPVALIELALMVTTLVHILKHPNYKTGSRPLWIIVVLLFQIIGPIVYFVFGKGEE